MPNDNNVTPIADTSGFDNVLVKAKQGLAEQAKKKFESKAKELGEKLVAARKANRDTVTLANVTLSNEEKIIKESFDVLKREYEDYIAIEFN
jgi:hypothetical protein